MGVLALIAAPVAVALTAIAGYLTVLGIAAFTTARQTPAAGARTRRFAVLVPAHDEAAVIGRLLSSLRGQRYPAERADIFVVADNCTDATAEIARRAGALVFERTEPILQAKGHALRWLLDRVRAHATYDAYVFFDADSVVGPDFLDRMDARLAAGAVVVQSYYQVLNAGASPATALREAALASLHYLRPLGRAALGLSCGLKGNGMCFEARVLDRVGWTSVGLAEDVELHLALVRNGIRVDFAPEAVVRADMPLTLAASRTQNLRWESGRLAGLRHEVLPLLATGIARRDPVRADAAIEQLVPPLSVAVTGGVAAALLGLAGGSPQVTALALIGTSGIIAHVFAGLVAVRAPRRTYRALLSAPGYILWKMALYVRAAGAGSGQPWIRTAREAPIDRSAGLDG